MGNKLPIVGTTNTHRNRSTGSDFFIPKPGRLHLMDGSSFPGFIPQWQTTDQAGEVVFNTGMTGYIESLTDPSYTNQILVFTYPLIGNYGVQLAASESDKIQVNGVVVSEVSTNWSHSASDRSLLTWLKSQDIPIISGVDTRSLTKHLRSKGTMLGSIAAAGAKPGVLRLPPKIVSVSQPTIYNPEQLKKTTKTVIVVDCGAKENIVRSLLAMGLQVKRVPYDYDYTAETYAGVLLSNGPGDPTDYPQTIAVTRKALQQNKPVFGICLGTQLMALAAGAKTYKLKFGHRGHNQPCLQTANGRGFITSQNHGYSIDEASLPAGWKVSFRNLNDHSVEGIEHKTKPFFSVQFHPEACPGPTDTAWLFERFYKSL